MSDLEKLTKEELIDQINDLKRDLNNEKYGLYFNRKQNPEEIVLECLNKIPILSHLADEDIINNGQENILIEGDNYPALSALNTIYPEGCADVIYIDPPYNTGNKDFQYNDNFVDEEDGFKHTKWLNFMEKRLSSARNLLKENGAIFISIDDNECANLELLCDEVFGAYNKIGVLPRVIKKGGKSTNIIAKNHDTLIIYAKNSDFLTFNKVIVDNDKSKNLIDEYYEERGCYKLTQCLDYDSLQYNETMDYEIDIDGEKFYAGGSKELWEQRHKGKHKRIDWVWRWSKPLFEWGYRNGFVVVKGDKRKRIYTKTYSKCTFEKDSFGNYHIVPKIDSKPYDSLFFTDTKFSNDNAKKELDKIGLLSKFDYPKPTSLIKETIKMVTTTNNCIVMDFFAGSGTTAQAVLELNKEDGGNRRFILCTNNENNIMTDVCYPRIKTVLTGIRPDGSKYSDGLSGNLRYFKVDFVEDSPYKEQAKYNLADQCDGLLCILESCFDKYSGGRDYNIYLNSKKDKSLSIFNNNYEEKEFDEMLSKVLSCSCKENVVYYFSLDSNVDPNIEKIVKSKLPGADVKPIPSKIYEIYKKIEDDVRRKY